LSADVEFCSSRTTTGRKRKYNRYLPQGVAAAQGDRTMKSTDPNAPAGSEKIVYPDDYEESEKAS
jgi:hypothetical protein